MEETKIQDAEEVKVEEKKEEQPVKEVPKGFYMGEVPATFSKVIVLEGNIVDSEALIIKMANSLREAGLMKD